MPHHLLIPYSGFPLVLARNSDLACTFLLFFRNCPGAEPAARLASIDGRACVEVAMKLFCEIAQVLKSRTVACLRDRSTLAQPTRRARRVRSKYACGGIPSNSRKMRAKWNGLMPTERASRDSLWSTA